MLELTTIALLEKLEETEECKLMRSEILNEQLKLADDEYSLASQILNETSERYFHLGFKTCLSILADIRK